MSASLPSTRGRFWAGWDSIRFLFVFGASYSSVTLDGKFDHPTEELPMGVEWPGFPYCEDGAPNYIGHLLKSTNARRDKTSRPRLLVLDYAIPGQTVAEQLKVAHEQFLPGAGLRPDWAHWDPSSSLFLIQLGINDCANLEAGNDMEARMSSISELLALLSAGGGQNFIFLDVPPMSRSPRAASLPPHTTHHHLHRRLVEERVNTWNAALPRGIAILTTVLREPTVLTYSLHDAFTRILDDPEAYGFFSESSSSSSAGAAAGDQGEGGNEIGGAPALDVQREGGPIWFDQVHPTSAVHAIIARELEAVLLNHDPNNNPRPA